MSSFRFKTDMVEDRSTKQKLSDKLASVDASLADIVSEIGVIQEVSSLQTTYSNGNLTQAKELDSSNAVVTQTDITYNADGTVNTITETIFGKKYVTTLNYVNGVLNPANPYTRSVN